VTGEAEEPPLPSVALIVPSRNGAHHLTDCLDSVAALDYDRDRLEVIVVDNASTDGSRELLRTRYPRVRVLEQGENLGFAEAVNVAAAATNAECLALANNDMRLEPAWLRRLVASYAPEAGYVCVGGVILDWEGTHVDFFDGFVNFHGAAAQDRFGQRLEDVRIEDGRELLFACGGSMLIGREVFRELGGFDPAFFAYFEDVDLGWRLWLAGHRVRLAAGARSLHRHHATGSTFPMYQRTLLFERNWLLMLLQNLEEANLERLLGPALLLLVERAVLETDSDRADYEPGAPAEAAEEPVPRTSLARLHAVTDVVADLERIRRRREEVQRTRRRADAEVLARFGRPFAPVREDATYLAAMARVTQEFGLDELFAQRKATRVLVVDAEGSDRLWSLAAGVASFVPVVYATRARKPRAPGVDVVRLRGGDALAELVAEVEVVVVSGTSAEAERLASPRPQLLVVDLSRAEPPEAVLRGGDLFLCVDEAERSRWLARLGDVGRRNAELVAVAEERDLAATLRAVVDDPFRLYARRPDGSGPRLTEDALRLLATWRYQYGVSRPAAWHVARALWRALPAAARPPLRRALRQRGRWRWSRA
jgi:GT2 family glycosyltransferase